MPFTSITPISYPNSEKALQDIVNFHGFGLWQFIPSSHHNYGTFGMFSLTGTEEHRVKIDSTASAILGLPRERHDIEFSRLIKYLHKEDHRLIKRRLEAALRKPGTCGAIEYRVWNSIAYEWQWVHTIATSYRQQNNGGIAVLGTCQALQGIGSPHATKINEVHAQLSRKGLLLRTVNSVADILLKTETNGLEQNLWKAMGLIAAAAEVDRICVWKNHIIDEVLHCTRLYEWSKGELLQRRSGYTADVPYSAMPGLEDALSGGQRLKGKAHCLPWTFQGRVIPKDIISVLILPIFLRGTFWGFICFGDSQKERDFSPDEEAFLRSVSILSAHAVVRDEMTVTLSQAREDCISTTRTAEQLKKMAYTDALTGLYNRYHFMELAVNSLEKAKRFHSRCYAMIMDLDFFKKINDTYGHLAGDDVLKAISATIRETVRSYDLLARYGGEEFVALISDESREAVLVLAERIRERVEKNPCLYKGTPITCTISIGIAESSPDCSLLQLLDRADRSLYAAKERGRNRVVML